MSIIQIIRHANCGICKQPMPIFGRYNVSKRFCSSKCANKNWQLENPEKYRARHNKLNKESYRKRKQHNATPLITKCENELCTNKIPQIRRNSKQARFCSVSCMTKSWRKKNPERFKQTTRVWMQKNKAKLDEIDQHDEYHCPCSRCHIERNVSQKLRLIAHPERIIAQMAKQKARYVKSLRNFVT